jgi:hypothetical protein
MREHKSIRHDDKAASRLAPKGRDGRFGFSVGTMPLATGSATFTKTIGIVRVSR